MYKIGKLVIVLLVVSLIVTMSSMLTFADFTIQTTEELPIVTYNFDTQTETESVYSYTYDASIFSLPSQPSASLYNIVPEGTEDERVQVNADYAPYCSIVELFMEFDTDGDGDIDVVSDGGSGFIAGPDLMVTAAHVIFHTGYNIWSKNVYCYTRRNGQNDYEERARGIWASKSSAYCEGNYTTDNDWALVRLNTNIGDRTGWFNVGVTTGSLNNYYLTVSGYPGDSDKRYTQWKDSGYVIATGTSYLSYVIDATGGQSGAPVYDSNYTVWGIHTVSGYDWNGGYRFSNTVYGYIQDEIADGLERYPR